MKTNVRIIRRPWKGNAIGAELEVNGPKARELVALNRAELVTGEPSPALKRVASSLATVEARKTARKAAAKKAPAKKAASKTTSKAVKGTQNRSMAGKTATK